MDELKLLIEMVANLPTLAVWVLVGYLVYKIVVIGSIYGLIRYGIEKLHSWLTKPKHELIEIRPLVNGTTMSGSVDALMAQLQRVIGRSSKSVVYIHGEDVDWLRHAIDDRIEKDAADAARKATEKAKG